MLDIKIKHTLKEELTVLMYDENYAIIYERELEHNDNFQVDLEEIKFVRFETETLLSEFVILNGMIQNILVSFNKKTKALDVSFYTNSNDYGFVKTVKFKDKLNLVHAKRNKKRVHILFPPNFNPDDKYNLLIMIDGQNMFDKKKVGKYTRLNDPYNGWQIETSLKMAYDKYNLGKFIVVGVETTGIPRMKELTLPSSFGELKKMELRGIEESVKVGALDKTADFIMDTVVPYIKSHYLITDYVGIGGSSAGGATAQYIGVKYNKFFKFILSLSPAMAIWSDETINKFYLESELKDNKNLPYYFYNMGNREGLEEYLNKLNENTLSMLKEHGYDDNKLITYYEPNGQHNEIMWRYAVAYAFEQIILKEKENNGKN